MKNPSALKSIEQDDPVDIASIDIHFVRAFIDMLYDRCDNVGTLEISTGTIAAMCHEALIKIDRIERFINAVPAKTVKIEGKDAA
ncbi:MAG: hypothetical protein M0042_11380 [Nitrospiraceae bacterium]|nr:hypothetical protein [Nitrospiraceae bacterium]